MGVAHGSDIDVAEEIVMHSVARTLVRAFARISSGYVAFALMTTLTCLVGCSSGEGNGEEATGSQRAPLSAPVRINCGAGSVSPFNADQFFSGGNTWTSANRVDTSGVANAAPASVYQSERYGNFTYAFDGLGASVPFVVRLHLAETNFTSSGGRKFNVFINEQQVLTNFDVFAQVGINKALVRDFPATTSATGQIAVRFANVVDNARLSGIEILTPDSANQAPTVATAASANPNPTNSTSSALSVLGADDGGEPNLTYTWAATGTPPAPVTFSANASNAAKNTTVTFAKAGSYTLVATIKDAVGSSVTSSVNVVVNATAPTPPASYRINCGGGSVGSFAADQYSSGGNTWDAGVVVSTTNVANAAPAAVYSTERWGNHSYTFGGLTAGASYTTRLHFAETRYSNSGARTFNVKINGAQVLTNFDIFATAGGRNKATALDFNIGASASGEIVVQYIGVVDNAKSSGIEIIPSEGANNNQPPTVALAASANSNPTSGTTTSLNVRGADDAGESNLTYTWTATGPASVSFSVNGSNAAQNSVATFSKAGSYTLSATIRDARSASVVSNVTVLVNQALSSISVTPLNAVLPVNSSQQYQASAKDQFGATLSSQPSMAWSVTGGGIISSSGLLSAGGSSGGPFQVKATSGSTVGSATFNVSGSSSAFSYQTNFGLNESPISEGGIWHNNGLDWTNVVTSGGIAYGTQGGHNLGPYDDSYAILSGWPPDQYAEGVIHIESGIPAQYAEVEILLRWSDSAHYSNGYECNLAYNGDYAVIGRWPGQLGTDVSQYTVICPETKAPFAPRNGDILAAQIVGYTITSWIIRDGVKYQLCTGTDNKSGRLATGSPGIGFYWAGSPATSKYGFSSFSAHSL